MNKILQCTVVLISLKEFPLTEISRGIDINSKLLEVLLLCWIHSSAFTLSFPLLRVNPLDLMELPLVFKAWSMRLMELPLDGKHTSF